MTSPCEVESKKGIFLKIQNMIEKYSNKFIWLNFKHFLFVLQDELIIFEFII